MGCDIHCCIEHKPSGYDRWRGFGRSINPGRDYRLFSLLAGVRGGSTEDSIAGGRGVPKDLGWYATDENALYVVETREEANQSSNCVCRERAERWVSTGLSSYTTEARQWVTNPDWHSHSWATPKEWRQAIEECRCNAPYFGIAAAMEEMERRGDEVRIVFWFDN